MENRKYIVNRDDVYVGEVVRAERIYRVAVDNAFFGIKAGLLHPAGWCGYRSMLFVLDENGFSSDLPYDTY